MKLGLGTVQFGLDYGISNGGGRTPTPEAARILAAAIRLGVRVLDTAPAYGDSEAVLGTLEESRSFRIVTKTPKFDPGAFKGDSAQALESSLRDSLRNLGIHRVFGLLFHQASDLLGKEGIRLMDKARECQAHGLVEKVGVSVYDAAEIDGVMERFGVDIVQVPVNVLDQRLIASGHLAALKRSGAEIHARSAFLQGLLLMEPDVLPRGMAAARAPLLAFREAASTRGLTPLEAALGFVTGLPEVDTVLCGVNDSDQLEAIGRAARPLAAAGFAYLAVGDASLLNPSKWDVKR